MIDLYKNNCVCGYASLIFSLKNFSKTFDWIFYQILQECSLDRGQVLFFSITQKSGLWSDTGAQAPLYPQCLNCVENSFPLDYHI